ncbi:MAG: PD-(D/E)XK nuclease family protein [Planctomycetota bacterium]
MRICYGRAGTGKTRVLLDHARDFITRDGADPTRLWLLQPTRDAVRGTLRELVNLLPADPPDVPRVALGVQAHTFSSLSLRLFDLLGEPRPVLLPSAMRPALVARALVEVGDDDGTAQRLTQRTGYRRLLAEFVGEALRNGLAPDRLSAASRQASEMISEDRTFTRRIDLLTSLLDRYINLCAADGMVDPEQLPALATALLRDRRTQRERIEQSVGLLLVDNFSRFTDSELSLLNELAVRADRTFLALCMPAPPRRILQMEEAPRAFAYLQRTREALTLFSQGTGRQWQSVELRRQRRFRRPSLVHLEQELFHAEPLAFGQDPVPSSPERIARLKEAAGALATDRSIRLISAPSVQAEAEVIAGEVRRLHSEGVPLESIAVLHRSADPYDRLLRAAFDRAGIPLDLARNVRLTDTAVWWMARDLLGMAIADPDLPMTPKALVTNPLIEPTLGSSVMADGYSAGLWKLKEWLNPSLFRTPAAVAHIGALQAAVADLRALALARPFRARALVTRLLAALRELGAMQAAIPAGPLPLPPETAAMLREQGLAARALDSALYQVADLLDPYLATLTTDDGDAGDGAAATAFLDACTESARQRRLRLDLPTERVGVRAGDVLHTRLPGDLQVVFVAGLMQGSFPPPPSSDPVLPDRDRMRLKMAGVWFEERSALREHEDFQFYVAVTRASTRLYLSHAERDSNGKEVLPSLYLRDVAAAFGIAADELPRIEAEWALTPAATTRVLDDDADLLAASPDDADDDDEAALALPPGAVRAPGPMFDSQLVSAMQLPGTVLAWQRLHTPDELLRWTVRTMWRTRELSPRTFAAWHAAAAIWDRFAPTQPELRRAVLAGWDRPDIAVLGPDARDHLRSSDRAFSASGINLFANCPYRFFARYHLGLEEPESAEPSAASWGTLKHSVLEELGRELKAGTMLAEPDPCADWAAQRLGQLAGDPDVGFPRLLDQERYRAELRMQTEGLRTFVRKEMELRARRGVLPVGFEVGFGFPRKEGLPDDEPWSEAPLVISDDRNRLSLRIRGYIDMLEAVQHPDRRGRRLAHVVDYKSGAVVRLAIKLKKFFKNDELRDEMRGSDSYPGERGDAPDFQLPIYLMAARELFGFEPVGAFFYSLSRHERRGVWREDSWELAAGNELSTYDRRTSYAFEQLIKNARELLLATARRMKDGEIAINPHDCMFCEFRWLCRFNKKEQDLLRARQDTTSRLAPVSAQSAPRLIAPPSGDDAALRNPETHADDDSSID